MATASAASVNPDTGVIALHAVLFAELGNWTPITPEDHLLLSEYERFAAEAQAARTHWDNVRTSRRARSEQCEEACNALEAAEDRCLTPLHRILHTQKRSALCFSGGGIRSSTFCLGVISALAKYSFGSDPSNQAPRLLAGLDYLSTVSGGGYVGSWLSSWITREGSTEAVLRQLAQTPLTKLDPEPKPLQHLRDYSNYLNPRLGLLSADTWTLAATTLRNIMLNWLVLIPFFGAALLLPVLYSRLLNTQSPRPDLILAAAFALGTLGTGVLMHNLPSFGNRQQGEARFAVLCLVPLALASVCFTAYWLWLSPDAARSFSYLHFALFGASMHAAGVLLGVVLSKLSGSPNFRRGHFQPKLLLVAFIAAIITGGLGASILRFAAIRLRPPTISVDVYSCIAVPIVFAALALIGVLSVGASSRVTDDEDREWWSRAGAWVLITSVSWLVFTSLVLLLPKWVAGIPFSWTAGSSVLSALFGWYATHAGASPKSGSMARGDQSARDPSPLSAWLNRVMVPLAAILFLIALAFAITIANQRLSTLQSFGSYLILIELAVAIIACYAVNVNKFSLHAMYRMRLIRAFLGASNIARKPNPFTGFDPADNLDMRSLSPVKPLHVLNLCLNLVSGAKLAWQQRKAESFTVTRLHSGSLRVGYQPSGTYGSNPSDGGISLGTAMTISGAAASPNMGYHSSALAAIVMTLFNARLGWWLSNPGEPGRRFWRSAGPAFSIRPFLDEALGRTNDSNRYIYLSDGGHFENLGLYEMVLRRCRFIIVVDAGADPDYSGEDLGNAVRKIRIDMGIPIEFPDGIAIHRGEGTRHYALGNIAYDCVDAGAEPGKILYIKPALSGNEPADVLNYQRANPAFPQQSTADQWFDESQFESYRRLGAHSVEEIFGSHAGFCEIEDLFSIAASNLSTAPARRSAAVG